MRSVSAAYKAAVKQSHEVVTKAEVLRDGNVESTLDVLSGSVSVDVDNAVRRRCDVTLADPDGTLTPASAGDLLAPFGNELRLWRGIRTRTHLPDYEATVKADEPVGYWRLRGDGNDESGNGQHLSLPAGAETVRGPLRPEGGDAVRNASAGGISFSSNVTTQAASMELWIKHDPAVDVISNYESFLHAWGTSNAFRTQRGQETKRMYLRVDTSAQTNATGLYADMEDDTWHHIVYTVDRGEAKGYKDGVHFGTMSYSHGTGFDFANIAPVQAEESRAEVAFYDRALTADEVKAHYDAGRRAKHFTDSDELLPLGVFGIENVDAEDKPDGVQIKVVGYDRAKSVIRARLEDVYTIPKGTNYATAIKDLIDSRRSGLTYNFMTTTNNTPALTFQPGDDPWKAASKMAESLGAELFFDAEGVCTLRPVPDPSDAPVVWEYEEGADATILSVSKSMSREGVYNIVLVTGETVDETTPPVQATAKDNDPNSPTWVDGSFGKSVRFFASPFVTTEAQAQSSADAMLRRSLGATEKVKFSAVPNPAHEAGDVVSIKRDKARVNARYVMDAFTVPLGADAELTATTRKREV